MSPLDAWPEFDDDSVKHRVSGPDGRGHGVLRPGVRAAERHSSVAHLLAVAMRWVSSVEMGAASRDSTTREVCTELMGTGEFQELRYHLDRLSAQQREENPGRDPLYLFNETSTIADASRWIAYSASLVFSGLSLEERRIRNLMDALVPEFKHLYEQKKAKETLGKKGYYDLFRGDQEVLAAIIRDSASQALFLQMHYPAALREIDPHDSFRHYYECIKEQGTNRDCEYMFKAGQRSTRGAA